VVTPAGPPAGTRCVPAWAGATGDTVTGGAIRLDPIVGAKILVAAATDDDTGVAVVEATGLAGTPADAATAGAAGTAEPAAATDMAGAPPPRTAPPETADVPTLAATPESGVTIVEVGAGIPDTG